MGFTDKRDRLPARGERVAAYVEDYLRAHPGLSVGELCVRIRADKRDLRRLLAERSVGHRLEDALAAYFGQHFIDALFPPELIGSGRSIRERELALELAEIAARNERLERDRAARRVAAARDVLRVVDDEGRPAAL